ncbi:MAG: TIGR04295 family B12-binding domain-containing radical SAM protein [Gammaproteobacteria bacterium]
MRVALVNPPWRFEHSTYFGCREPHLPLELGYARALLDARGHDTLMLDGHLTGTDAATLAAEVLAFRPDMVVVTTAPSYLFWRCAQPELRVPRDMIARIRDSGAMAVAVGPHGSSTPRAALTKLGADVVIRGECEDAVLALAEAGSPEHVPGAAWRDMSGEIQVNGPPQATMFVDTPPLAWPDGWIARHHHHHHRFDAAPDGPGAEVEASRGCPYACTFCAKIDFRDRYRRRRLDLLLAEIDGLLRQGVTYLYFIDEIFLPQRPLLEALRDRDVRFGVQTRIDLWKPDMLDLLGEAGCVSVEAGIESLTEEGRASLDKKCRLSTGELSALLIHARRRIPFVQANLILSATDDKDTIAAWREGLRTEGVWANDPVPLFPYPSSPDYRRLFGEPDEMAWERAHAHYLDRFSAFSDIQEAAPLPLPELERLAC